MVLGGGGPSGEEGQPIPEVAGPPPAFQVDQVPTEVPSDPSR